MKKILVSAGDPSGDQLLAHIIKSIHEQAPGQYEFLGLAGPLCEHQGVKVLVQSKEVAVVGAVEVLRNLGVIFKSLTKLSHELKDCESLLCVDFPDFNFRLAAVAKKLKKPVDYIVAPQVWAWRRGRILVMKSWLRRLYPALPFEEGLFREHGVDAKFLGHPLRDVLPPRNRRGAREIFALNENENILALFPGSRTSEISRNLPLMIDAWGEFKRHSAKWGVKKKWRGLLTLAQGWTLEELIALIPEKQARLLAELLAGDSPVNTKGNTKGNAQEGPLKAEWQLSFQNHASLMASDFGWITSGTASLEAAYYQLPHVLLYKMNAFSAMLLQFLSSYFRDPNSYAGLPNILLEKRVIPELLQSSLTAKRLAFESLDLLQDAHKLDLIKKQLRFIPKRLGESGVSQRIAEDLLIQWNAKK